MKNAFRGITFAKMTTFTLFLCLSCAGVAVPFALNNQLTPGGLFDYKIFKCAPCTSFWLAILLLLFVGGGQVVFAGLAPLFALAINRMLV